MVAFWLFLLRCVAVTHVDEEGFFLYHLSTYSIIALNTKEVALCYMRPTGAHGCKVVQLASDEASVTNLKKLNFSAPETQWGTPEHRPPLQTRGVADDLFVLCAKPHCMVAHRIGNEFKFSPPMPIQGKLISLTLTQALYDHIPGQVTACTRTNATTKNSLFDLNVDCADFEVFQDPLALALPGTIPRPAPRPRIPSPVPVPATREEVASPGRAAPAWEDADKTRDAASSHAQADPVPDTVAETESVRPEPVRGEAVETESATVEFVRDTVVEIAVPSDSLADKAAETEGAAHAPVPDEAAETDYIPDKQADHSAEATDSDSPPHPILDNRAELAETAPQANDAPISSDPPLTAVSENPDLGEAVSALPPEPSLGAEKTPISAADAEETGKDKAASEIPVAKPVDKSKRKAPPIAAKHKGKATLAPSAKSAPHTGKAKTASEAPPTKRTAKDRDRIGHLRAPPVLVSDAPEVPDTNSNIKEVVE